MSTRMKLHPQFWKSWCRLCAKSDLVSIKSENAEDTNGENNWLTMDTELQANQLGDLNLSTATEKVLGVKINDNKELPQSVCRECHSLLKTVMNFIQRTEKVQIMYADLIALETKKCIMKLSTEELHMKYGLVENQEHCVISEMENYTDAKKIFQISEMEEVLLKVENTDEEIEKVECLFNAANAEIFKCNDSENLLTTECPKVRDPLDEKEPAINSTTKSDNDEQLSTWKSSKPESELIDNDCIEDIDSEKVIDLYDPKSANTAKSRDCPKEQSGNEKCFPCPQCSKVFMGKSKMNRHIIRIHGKKPKLPLSCNQCERTFTVQHKLTQHLKIHLPMEMRKVHSCTYCEKKVTTKYNLRKHIDEIHLNEQPFICEQCGAALKSAENLKIHLRQHSDYAPFKCDVCPRRYRERSNLTRHMQVHDSKRYDCPKCDMKLKTRATLLRHMAVHSDEKRHICKTCGRAFRLSKTLKIHEMRHTGVKRYACEFCDRAFPVNSDCRTHQKTVHPEEFAAQKAVGGDGVASKTHTIGMSKFKLSARV